MTQIKTIACKVVCTIRVNNLTSLLTYLAPNLALKLAKVTSIRRTSEQAPIKQPINASVSCLALCQINLAFRTHNFIPTYMLNTIPSPQSGNKKKVKIHTDTELCQSRVLARVIFINFTTLLDGDRKRTLHLGN